MNLKTRIERIEGQIKPIKRVVWDFSHTTDEQLMKLKNLVKTNQAQAEYYTQQLIDGGFLKYEHKKQNQTN